MRPILLTLLGLMPFFITPAHAAVDSNAMTQCLIAHNSPEMESKAKKFMVAVLTEDYENTNTYILEFGLAIINNAMTNCGLEASQIEEPGFTAASEAYGAFLGQKVMADALAKMGL